MVTYIQWGQGVRTCATLRGVRNPKAEGDKDQKQVLLRSAYSPSSWLSSGGPQSRHIRNWEPAPLKIPVIASSVSKKERGGLPLKYTPWPDVRRNDGIPAWLRPNGSLQPQRSQGLWGQHADIFYPAGNTVMTTLSSVSYGRNTGDIYFCHFISITGNILSPVNRNMTESPSKESWHLTRFLLFQFYWEIIDIHHLESQVYSMMFWFTCIVKCLPQQLQITFIILYRYNIKERNKFLWWEARICS